MDNYIIAMHEYAIATLDDGCTLPEMMTHLEKKGYNLDKIRNSVIQVFGQIYVDSYRVNIGYSMEETARYWMQTDAYYRHLDFLEMQEAHKNAQSASTQAKWAIGVSAGFALIQIAVALLSGRS